jgi:hypothetical protein
MPAAAPRRIRLATALLAVVAVTAASGTAMAQPPIEASVAEPRSIVEPGQHAQPGGRQASLLRQLLLRAELNLLGPTVASPRPDPANTAKSVGRGNVERTPSGAVASTTYRGRNHVWMPSLGISRDLSWYACGRTSPPGNGLYRWGCAGRNNLYLLAHAATTFKPLHDAYVRGRLRRGMPVIHADARGRITVYRVRYWRVVSPVGAAWAYAAQSRRSMTLQTCVGARSQYRLVVRLVAD